MCACEPGFTCSRCEPGRAVDVGEWDDQEKQQQLRQELISRPDFERPA